MLKTFGEGNIKILIKNGENFWQIGMLSLRINDMMAQLNTVTKTMMDENAALKKENAELKAKQEKTSKS
jgi:regulator of replication initiation timing